MKVDKFINSRSGSAHLIESAYETERLEALGIRTPRYSGYEDPRTAKVREEHRIRNVQEAKHRKASGE